MKKHTLSILALALALGLLLAACGTHRPGGAPNGAGSSTSLPGTYTGETWNDGSKFADIPSLGGRQPDGYALSEDGNTLTVTVEDINARGAMDYWETLMAAGATGTPDVNNKVTMNYSGTIGDCMFSSTWWEDTSPLNDTGAPRMVIKFEYLSIG